ncbi:hypothetical protein IWQ61_010234 [Dispira simplex]|nr:hypothetical protein IWQ61_010234 [Dispira simplex]
MKINILTIALLVLTAFLTTASAFDHKEAIKMYNDHMFSTFGKFIKGKINAATLYEAPFKDIESAEKMRVEDGDEDEIDLENDNEQIPQNLPEFMKWLDSPKGKNVIGEVIQDEDGNYSSSNLHMFLGYETSKNDIANIETLFGLVEGNPVKDSQFYMIKTSIDDSTGP